MELKILVDEAALNRVKASLGEFANKAPNAIAGAINETTAEAKTSIAKAIYDRINLPSGRIKREIDIKKARASDLTGWVRLSHEKRIGLKDFGAKQTKAGVSYKIGRKEARKTISDAFILGSLEGHVFAKGGERKRPRPKKLKRTMKIGAKRRTKWMWPDLKIKKRFGISPWGAFVKAGLVDKQFIQSQAVYEKNLQQRVNAIVGGFVRSKGAA